MRLKFEGPLLIAVAAFLWATDAVFRLPSLGSLGVVNLVFIEHALGLLILLPFVLFTQARIKLNGARQWVAALIIGVGGSATATLLFTQSFLYLSPTAAILLQKLQPIVVILLAKLYLRENPAPTFYPWAALAVVAALGVSVPPSSILDLNATLIGIGLAGGAAMCWAVATIAGKSLLKENLPISVTFWRYFFGTLATGLVLGATGRIFSSSDLNKNLLFALIYMSLGPGLLSLIFYYRGLKKTSASVATLIELVYPLSAVALNWWFLKIPLSGVQLGCAGVLLFSMTRIQVPRRW